MVGEVRVVLIAQSFVILDISLKLMEVFMNLRGTTLTHQIIIIAWNLKPLLKESSLINMALGGMEEQDGVQVKPVI